METTEMKEKAQDWRETAEDLKAQAQKWQQRVTETAQDTGRAVHTYVHENTWTSLAIAAVLGCTIGWLLSRNRD